MKVLNGRAARRAAGLVLLIGAVGGAVYSAAAKDRRRGRPNPDARAPAPDPERERALRLDRLKHEHLWVEPPAAGRPHDWPQFRGPLRDGAVRGVTLAPDWAAREPEILWRQPCGGGYASVTVAGGRAYLHDRPPGEDRERIRCFDADTGKQHWAHSYPADYAVLSGAGADAGPLATPTVHDGRLYAVGALGRFVCLALNAADGAPAVVWDHDLIREFDAPLPVWGVACSPLIVDGLVVVQPGGKRGSVAAFDRVTGKLQWASLEEVSGYSSPVLADAAGVRQVIALSQGRLVGLRPDTGAYLWQYVWRESASVPLVTGDYAFITCDHGCALVKIEAERGALKAERVFECGGTLLASQIGTPVAKDGFIYGFHGDVHTHGGAKLTCVDPRDPGAPRWQSNKVLSGQVIRFGDLLFVQTQDGDLWLVRASPDGYCQLGHLPGVLRGDRAWAAPAAVGNRVFLRDDRTVLCLELPGRGDGIAPLATEKAVMVTTPVQRRILPLPLIGRLAAAWHRWTPILPDAIVSQYQGAGVHVLDPEIPPAVLDRARRDMDARAAAGPRGRADAPWINGWPESRAIRAIALAPKIHRVLRQLYGRQTFAFQTMNHRVGTELPAHRDSVHWATDPPGFMCGVWVALEDMDLTNGTLVYYPYSHKLPAVRTEDFSPEPGLAYYSKYEDLIRTMIDRSGLQPEYAVIPKGTAVIWASDMIHGGLPRADRSRTRYSQVTHYTFAGCQYYFPLESYGAHRHLLKPDPVR